ncbi:MAG: lipid A biosynthesis lauroyl acyltransferase, partial [Gammaproteobacteria bacterium]
MPPALLKPRTWPTWAGLGLLYLLIRLPYPWQLALGRGLGRLLFLAMPRRRRIASINLALCFPELSEKEREDLLRTHFASLGIAPFEMAMGWWAKDKRLEGLARIEGLSHLKKALAQGKGAILLSGHFTTVDIGGRFLARHLPFCALYRQAKNPAFEYVLKRARERRIEKAIPRRDMRGMLRCLRA